LKITEVIKLNGIRKHITKIISKTKVISSFTISVQSREYKLQNVMRSEH
jgi:hypothetical protein